MAIQQCDRLIALKFNDELLRKHKATILIKSSAFDQAISLLREKPLNATSRFLLAYCYYRKERYEDALAEISSGTNDASYQILRTQILYRLGKFRETSDLYLSIVQNVAQTCPDLDFHDIFVNTLAGLNESNNRQEIESLLEAHPELMNSNDVLLNAYLTTDEQLASRQIDLIHAAKPLTDLIRQGEVVSADDKGLCGLLSGLCILAGRREEAMAYLKALLPIPSASMPPVLEAVCANNWTCMQESGEIFDSHRKIKHCLSHSVGTKLNRLQKSTVMYNNALLHMHMRKFPMAASISKVLMKENQESIYPLIAAIYSTWKTSTRPAEAIEHFCQENNLASIERFAPTLRLILAQISFLHTDHRREFNKILQKFPEHERYSLGVVSAAMRMTDSSKDAICLLQAAIDFWESQDTKNFPTIHSLITLLAEHFMSNKMYEHAAGVLRKLLSYTHDRQTIRRLVYALSYVDAEKSYALGVENDCLVEKDDWSYSGTDLESEVMPRVTEDKTSGHLDTEPKRKTRRSKKKKPAAVQGETAPDPERWIPLRDRQSLKKAGKKTLARMAEERRQYALEKRLAHAQRVASLNEPSNEAIITPS